MTWPYFKKVQFWGYFGISGNFLGMLGPKMDKKFIFGQTKKDTSKNSPNDTENPKNLE